MLDAAWGFIRYIYGGESSVEPQLAELARVKLAWNNGCVHCSLARSSTAVSRAAPEGADPSTGAATFERQVDRLGDYEHSDLPERTKMALRLADAISMAPEVVDEHFYARLQRALQRRRDPRPRHVDRLLLAAGSASSRPSRSSPTAGTRATRYPSAPSPSPDTVPDAGAAEEAASR